MAAVVINLRLADDVRDVVHQTVQALAEGKIVAFPTETVYGLAASASTSEPSSVSPISRAASKAIRWRWPSKAPTKPATTSPTCLL